MNRTSKQLLKLARKNALLFTKNKNVKAVIVTGSVAQGTADDNSDIDTVIYLKKPLNKKEFEKIVGDAKASGGGFYNGTPKEGFAVYYYINGIKCDFGFGFTKELELMINNIPAKPDTDLTKHLIISGFIDSVVLYGAAWVNKWKRKARRYPDALADEMIKINLHFYPKWVMEKMCAGRGDTIFYYENILDDIKKLFAILCGLNKIYHPGKLKRMKRTVNLMKIKPSNFSTKCESLFRPNPYSAINDLYKLIDAVLSLVEKHRPQVSTERTREIIGMVLRK